MPGRPPVAAAANLNSTSSRAAHHELRSQYAAHVGNRLSPASDYRKGNPLRREGCEEGGRIRIRGIEHTLHPERRRYLRNHLGARGDIFPAEGAGNGNAQKSEWQSAPYGMQSKSITGQE